MSELLELAAIQQHPDYHTGFYDAMEGEPLFDDCPSREYREGWTAFWEFKAELATAIRAIDGARG